MSDAMAMIAQATGNEEPVRLDGDEVRGKSDTRQVAVTAEGLALYAAATNDTRPERVAGEVASPAWAFVAVTELLFDAVNRIAEELSPTGLVHTHQDITFVEHVRAGDKLTVDAHVVDLRDGPFGGVVKVLAQTHREDGTLLNSQLITGLVVGSRVDNPILDPAYAPPAEAALPVKYRGGSTSISVDRDHTVRYAAASGDENPMHLDPAFARQNGFPGVIMHGVGTLAIACHALEAQHPDRSDVSQLSVEWTRPVFPGDRLTLRWQDDEDGLGIRFDVVNRRQRTVMRGGRLTWRA